MLTNDQLRLLGAGGGDADRRAVLKLEPFDPTDSDSFRTFEARCAVAKARNSWGQQCAKEMVFGAITGDAAIRVEHIRIGGNPEANPVPADARTYDDFMRELKRCFHHVEQSALARVAFQKCRQKASEEALSWHTRARVLFKEAFPARDWDTDEELINKFCHGLIDEQLSIFVTDQNPQTYTDCLNLVQQKQGRLAQIRAARGNAKTGGMYALEETSDFKYDNYGHIAAFNHIREGAPPPTSRSANAFLRSRGPEAAGDSRQMFRPFKERGNSDPCGVCNRSNHRTEDCRELASLRRTAAGSRRQTNSGKGATRRRPNKKSTPGSSGGGRGRGNRNTPSNRKSNNAGRGRNVRRGQRSRGAYAMSGESDHEYEGAANAALDDCLAAVRLEEEEN